MTKIGNWGTDKNGLPNYNYTGGYPVSSTDRIGRDAQLPDDPCFILGNYRLNVFAHASGIYELISGERGWARLNANGLKRGWNQTEITVGEKSYRLVDNPSDDYVKSEVFGAGYARYSYTLPEGISVTRVLSTAPSCEINTGLPIMLMSFVLHNSSDSPLEVSVCEQIKADYRLMSAPRDVIDNVRRTIYYTSEMNSDSKQNLALAKIIYNEEKLVATCQNRDEAFPYDCFPPTLFLNVRGEGEVFAEQSELGDILYARAGVTLHPNETKVLSFNVGYVFSDDINEITKLIDKAYSLANEDECSEGAFAKLWAEKLPNFDESDEVMRREMLWNAYVLEVMATYNEYFGETYIPQGSVYAYHLGQNASVRDHAQHLMPLIYENPQLAKSCIRFILKHSAPTGEIYRQSVGYGFCDFTGYRESDPQLYLFMAVGEYLRVTGDYSLLDETAAHYPVEGKISDTVFGMLVKCFVYLRDDIGRGRNGLIRMLRSDWSDSFFRTPGINHRAESHMNTAMALCVLPTLADALEGYSPKNERDAKTLPRLINEMRAYRKELYDAFMADMEGKKFSPRCYLGDKDEERFGIDNMCVEPQIFVLQMKDFPIERKRELWSEVQSRILGMEKIGARTREVPLHDKEGKGEDGGTWFSHQGPMIVGASSVDREGALKLMRQLTFNNYAEHYPDYWVGHWTFADSLESTLSNREGLYHFWTPNAFQPFCAHAHAWMLYCYYRVYRCEK